MARVLGWCMEVMLVAAVVVGALVPTLANATWEWWLARGTRAYVDRRVRESEAKAQRDRDMIFAEAKAGRERVEQLIAALQQPAGEQPAPSPGFAHGVVDPAEAVEARELKKRERKQRQIENQTAIVEAVGEKALLVKKLMGADWWKEIIDSEDTIMAVEMVKKVVGKVGGTNGHGHGATAPYV